MKNGVVMMMVVVSAARQRMREGGGRGGEVVVHVGVDGLVEERGGWHGLGLALAGEERGGHAASREGDVGEAGRVQRDRGCGLQLRGAQINK